MTALDRLETEECLENFNRLQPLLIQPAQFNLAVPIYIFLQFAKYVIINTPRRFFLKVFTVIIILLIYRVLRWRLVRQNRLINSNDEFNFRE